MSSLFDAMNDEPWYCPICMTHKTVVPIPSMKDGTEIMELFCDKGHFVTRMNRTETGWNFAPEVLGPDKHPVTQQHPKNGTLFIPLTDDAIAKIRTGNWLEYHFHDLRFNKGRITFIVGQRASIPEKTSKIARDFMKQGDVQPIVLSEQDLDRIVVSDGGLACQAANTDLQVCVITEKAAARARREQHEYH